MKHVKACKNCGGPTNHECGCWCPFCSGACEFEYEERGAPRLDDHPNSGPHTECLVDHGGKGVRRHCRRGCKWPCPDVSVDPEPCPDCGSTDRFRKMYATLCANCRVVLDVSTPPRLSVSKNDDGGFDVT